MPKMNLSHFEAAFLFSLFTSIVLGVVTKRTDTERLHYGAGYHLKLFALSQPLTGELADRVTQINAELETLVRQCPEQYLWGYNRYKRPAGAPEPA